MAKARVQYSVKLCFQQFKQANEILKENFGREYRFSYLAFAR